MDCLSNSLLKATTAEYMAAVFINMSDIKQVSLYGGM
jgi:hypothetical protein